MRALQGGGAHDLRHVNLPNLGNAVCLGQEHIAGLQIHVHHLGRSIVADVSICPAYHTCTSCKVAMQCKSQSIVGCFVCCNLCVSVL